MLKGRERGQRRTFYRDKYLKSDDWQRKRALGVSKRIEELRSAVEKEIGRKAKHVESTPVIETFRGVLVWNGVVETFGIARHPQVKLCYAFIYVEDNGKARRIVVKATPEVNSPRRAFGRFFVSRLERRY